MTAAGSAPPDPDVDTNQRLETLRNQINRILRDRFMTTIYLYSLLPLSTQSG